MVFKTVQVHMDSGDWQESLSMQSDRERKAPHEDILSCSRPRMKQQAGDQAFKCPRCDSANTKFCYYNNYSLSQPRHFCKTCRRYWTRGGALRNVPVGGGCRKNKRVKRSGLADHEEPLTVTASTTDLLIANNPSNSILHYSGLPSCSGNDFNLAFARIQQAAARAFQGRDRSDARISCTDYLGLDPSSSASGRPLSNSSAFSCNTLSALGAAANSSSTHSAFSGHVELARQYIDHHGPGAVHGDLSSFLEAINPQISGIPPPTTGNLQAAATNFTHVPSTEAGITADSINQWAYRRFLQAQRMALIPIEGEQAAASGVPFDAAHTAKLATMSVKVEEGHDQNRFIVSDQWQVSAPPDQTLFHTTGDSDYWINGGSWPDLTANYASSVTPLV
eukprot:Gb_23562 [translate_table: standard]